MKIFPITRERLSKMQVILNASAGYAVNIADEIKYFDQNASTGWWLATSSDENQLAFIRHFKQNVDWSLGEIYVSYLAKDRAILANALLEKFQNSVQFSNGHRLRFDVKYNDEVLNRVMKENGFSEKAQIFRFFERSDLVNVSSCQAEFALVSDAQEVAETLSNLHPVSFDEAKKWIENKTIMIIRDHKKVVAAAQIYESDDSIEVNRFATHEKCLRRGFAKRLMSAILRESAIRRKRRVFLKVEDNRRPAIALYRSVGFIEKTEYCEVWHSRWY